MTDWQHKVRAGDPIRMSASAYNQFVDTSIASKRRRTGRRRIGQELPGGMAWGHNIGTTDLPAWTPTLVTSVSTIQLARGDSKFRLEINEQTIGTPRQRATTVVTQEPIMRGTIGRVMVSGVTICKVADDAELVPSGTTLGYEIGYLTPMASGCAVLLGGSHPQTGTTNRVAVVRLGVQQGTFTARLHENPEQIGSTARWRYGFTEVEWDADEWVDVLAGRSSQSLGTAINMLEAANSAQSGYGFTLTPPAFTIRSTGVTFQPVPAGTVVEITSRIDTAGDPVYLFSAPNLVDGPCNPAATLANETGGDEVPAVSPTPEEQAP